MQQYADNFKNVYEQLPGKKLFRITYDASVNQFRLITKQYGMLDEIRRFFSTENPGAFFSRQYGYKVEPRIYNINQFGYFAIGLVYEVIKWIKANYGNIECIAMSPQCQAFMHDWLTPLKSFVKEYGEFEISNISDDSGRNAELQNSGRQPFQFRDYQKKAIHQLLFNGFGRGLIEVPTAGGKSFILANLIWNLLKNFNRKMKFLLLVPNTQLVAQFYSDLLDYGYEKHDIAKFMGGMNKKDLAENDINEAKVVIANRQYVFKNRQKLPQFDCLICDECHQTLAEATREFVDGIKCKFKFGCSGTLPQGKYDKFNLIGMFSRVVFKEQITHLQDQGFISKLKITLLDVVSKEVENNRQLLFNLNTTRKYKPDEFGNSDIAFDESFNAEFAYFNLKYIELFTPVIEYVAKLPENSLVLFDKIEVGKNLFELASNMGTSKKIHYIDGATPVKQREEIRKHLEQDGDNILIGNVAIVGTGINIKRLNNIVFLINTKSHSRVLQSIGRILRLHSTKDVAHLIDVRFNTKYSYRHYEDRCAFYKQFYAKRKPDEVVNIMI